jgi:hypothetical protein
MTANRFAAEQIERVVVRVEVHMKGQQHPIVFANTADHVGGAQLIYEREAFIQSIIKATSAQVTRWVDRLIKG